jgi:hypothetical protein
VVTQPRAASGWHGAHRLRRITAPTTAVLGVEDRLLRVHNGMRTAQLIPGARYVELPGVGHLVAHDAPMWSRSRPDPIALVTVPVGCSVDPAAFVLTLWKVSCHS